MPKEIRITPIKNGTVIDHLNAGSSYKILEVLNLRENSITVAINAESRKMGKKDIIFIQERELNEKELAKIALIGKGATVNIIANGEIKNKTILGYPEKVEEIIKCINPKCVTNNETLKTKFYITAEPLEAKCFYCETRMNEEEIAASIKK
ncbi:MAG: aspartate carbamoyltransferase regulatory subunit [Candidatus Diapherotrites archaeon CG11_big_fil_rev_8_21_14_0_20_37_9]|nr:MAG: aspartate carbamoyltransferase regulatory subunit [Candidatus Diapherotrites archaeon CG11_big_fil_rev_8_21_14_0_20_37_9]